MLTWAPCQEAALRRVARLVRGVMAFVMAWVPPPRGPP